MAIILLNGCAVAGDNRTGEAAANDTSPNENDNSPGVLVAIEEFDGQSAEMLELIYEDDNYNYFLSSLRSAMIMLVFDNGERISLKDAIERKKVGIEELLLNGLQIYMEEKEEWTDLIFEFTPDEIIPHVIPEHGSTVDLGCCVKDIICPQFVPLKLCWSLTTAREFL